VVANAGRETVSGPSQLLHRRNEISRATDA
jgi:hypothetical protein